MSSSRVNDLAYVMFKILPPREPAYSLDILAYSFTMLTAHRMVGALRRFLLWVLLQSLALSYHQLLIR